MEVEGQPLDLLEGATLAPGTSFMINEVMAGRPASCIMLVSVFSSHPPTHPPTYILIHPPSLPIHLLPYPPTYLPTSFIHPPTHPLTHHKQVFKACRQAFTGYLQLFPIHAPAPMAHAGGTQPTNPPTHPPLYLPHKQPSLPSHPPTHPPTHPPRSQQQYSSSHPHPGHSPESPYGRVRHPPPHPPTHLLLPGRAAAVWTAATAAAATETMSGVGGWVG